MCMYLPACRGRATLAAHGIEPLESRIAPAVLTVNSLADDGSSGTLRFEINKANTVSGNTTIVFSPSFLPRANHKTFTSVRPSISRAI